MPAAFIVGMVVKLTLNINRHNFVIRRFIARGFFNLALLEDRKNRK